MGRGDSSWQDRKHHFGKKGKSNLPAVQDVTLCDKWQKLN